ncbi:hypothetical protein HU200_018036 [Digitaria exilis]|uniref:Cytochrome P450 n=1 Tax=Digitaria exilis TaxID=1010633 RepID=A0A835F574_9POAL|nr:hypothetical protein HU200_018036 [Digitaria exilis]
MEHGFWLLLATLATSLVYYLGSLRRRRQVSPRLPPGPRPLPVIGNALHLRRGQLHHALARLARTHGPVMRLQLGPIPAVVISSRDAAMEAFTKHDRRLTGRPTLDAIRALGWADRSVINSPSSDPLWRAQRGILAAHAFSPRSLAAARGVHERKVRDMVGYLRARSGKEVDVGRALYGGVINLVSSSFFSTDVVDMGDAAGESAHGIRELVENISHLVTKPNISDLVPFLRPFDLQGLRRAAARYLGEIFGIVDGIIERRLAENTSSGSGDKKHGDFLQVLIDLMSTGDIDRDTAKALVFELFLAGGETITVTVEWAMAELLRNPRVMAKLHAEINGALGGKEVIEEPDVARLPYLQAVVKEAMRLHAAAPLLVPHRAVEDGVEICGYAVPKGTTVFVNVWAIMRDPSLWDKPEEFVPERFMGRAAGMDYKGNHFEFIPLGSGRRQCPGLPVAECVVPHLLASLLRAFEWRLPEGISAEQLDMSERYTSANVLAKRSDPQRRFHRGAITADPVCPPATVLARSLSCRRPLRPICCPLFHRRPLTISPERRQPWSPLRTISAQLVKRAEKSARPGSRAGSSSSRASCLLAVRQLILAHRLIDLVRRPERRIEQGRVVRPPLDRGATPVKKGSDRRSGGRGQGSNEQQTAQLQSMAAAVLSCSFLAREPAREQLKLALAFDGIFATVNRRLVNLDRKPLEPSTLNMAMHRRPPTMYVAMYAIRRPLALNGHCLGINSVENNHDLRRRQPPSSIAPDIFSVAVASTTSKWPPAPEALKQKAAPRKMEHGQVWLLCATLAVSLLYYLSSFRRRQAGSGRRLPPGPRPLPVIGNALDLRGNLHHTLARLARTYGPVMSLQLGPVPAVAISSRDAAMEAFTKHDRRLAGRHTVDAVRALGWADLSVVNMPSSDPLWKLQRGILAAHVFSPRSLAAARGVRERKVRELAGYFRARAGKEVDVGRGLYGGLVNLVSSAFFSVDVVDMEATTSESAHGIREHVENIAHLITKANISDLFPFLRPLDLQGLRRAAARHLGEIHRIVDGIIERRVAEDAAASGDGCSQHDDFLQVLLDLMSTGKIDRDTVKAIVFEIFLTGAITTTVTVEWAMAELLRNPSTMAKLRAEISGALGGKETIDEADVAGLPYLQAVVKEALRLHPAAPLMVPHKAIDDSVEVCGYAVPKGCTVFINVWAIMRDPALWDSPEEFLPERFLGKAAEVDFKGKDFEFIPFGYGRRQCPGIPLAERVVPHLLASLLHAFEWRLPEGMSAEQLNVSERFTTGNVLAVPLWARATLSAPIRWTPAHEGIRIQSALTTQLGRRQRPPPSPPQEQRYPLPCSLPEQNP